MPASLSAIVSNRARLERTFEDGESFYIDYKPGNLTPRQLHMMQTLRAQGFDTLSEAEQLGMMDALTQMIADMVIDTNALDSNQRRIVPTVEGLQDVSYPDQFALLVLIQEDQGLPKANGTGKSPASSSGISALPPTVPAATSPHAPNGTSSARSRSAGKRK